MNKIIVTSLVMVSVASGIIASTSVAEATTVNNNRGSIVQTSGGYNSIDDNRGSIIQLNGTAANVSNNRGSIIQIDGKGMDINTVLESSEISNNRGSIIQIRNVCGTLNDSTKITNNRGSIIQIKNTSDMCKVTVITPTSPEVPKTPVTPKTPEVDSNPKGNEMPVELPRTGMGSTTLIAGFISILSAGTTYLIRRGQ